MTVSKMLVNLKLLTKYENFPRINNLEHFWLRIIHHKFFFFRISNKLKKSKVWDKTSKQEFLVEVTIRNCEA
jgi:hypothetical protein